MGNKKKLLERLLTTYKAENPFELIRAFFDNSSLDAYKKELDKIIFYSHRKEIYRKESPAQVFDFYKRVHTFLRACYLLQTKEKKWEVRKSSQPLSVLQQASLTKEEYQTPFLVFQRAFKEKALEEFDDYLSEIIYFSLSPFTIELESDTTIMYIYIVKMLDAAEVVHERGVKHKKDKKSKKEA